MSDILFDNLVFDRLREIGDQSQRIGGLESEIARLRLTDAEREAIREAVGAYNDNDDDEECAKIAATLHGILKRLG
jgi:uncharacterized small protein (DUF1192 family)